MHVRAGAQRHARACSSQRDLSQVQAEEWRSRTTEQRTTAEMNKPRQRTTTWLHLQAHRERKTRTQRCELCASGYTEFRSAEPARGVRGQERRGPLGGRRIALTTLSLMRGIWGLDPGETVGPGPAGSQRWGTTPLQAHLDTQTKQLSALTLNSPLHQSPTGPNPPQHQAARAHPRSPSPPK